MVLLAFWQLEVMGVLAHSKDFPNVHKNFRSHTEKESKSKILQLKHWFLCHNGEILSTQKEPLPTCCPTVWTEGTKLYLARLAQMDAKPKVF